MLKNISTKCTTWLGICSTALFLLSDPMYPSTATCQTDIYEDCSGFADFHSCANSPTTVGKTLIVSKKFTVGDLDLFNRGLLFLEGGKLLIGKGKMVTHHGKMDAPLFRIFEGEGSFIFGKGSMVTEVYPEWWGDRSDDDEDDTLALESAMKSVTGIGGQVRISSGVHIVAMARLQDNIRLVGNGNTSVLKIKAGSNTHALATKDARMFRNIYMANLSIDGNKAANPKGGSGIVVAGRDITIENVSVKNTANACMIFGYRPGGGNYRALNNYCLNPATAENNWGGIAATGGRSIFFSGNIVESTDGFMTYGIDIEPNPDTPAAEIGDILITGNTVKGGRIYADGGNILSPIEHITITGNQVDARRSKNAGVTAPFYMRNVKFLSITGNMSRSLEVGNDPVLGLYLDNVSFFDISGNSIFLADVKKRVNYGIYFLSGKPSTHGKITGNLISGTEQTPIAYGIYGYSGSAVKDIHVEGNSGNNIVTLKQLP